MPYGLLPSASYHISFSKEPLAPDGASAGEGDKVVVVAGGVDNLVCSNSTQLPEVKLPVGGSNSFVRSASPVDGSTSSVRSGSPTEEISFNSSVRSDSPSESISSNSSVQSSLSESTTSPDQSFIDSPFEDIDNNIPSIAILKNLVLLDSVELMLMLILIFIVINKYLYKFNIKLLYKLVLLIPNKYLPNIFKNRFNNLDKAVDFNNKFYNILFGILIIILLLFKLAHIYFSSELYSNIDDYILVYNYIKKSNLLLLVIPFLPNKFKFNGLTKLPCSNIINKFTLSGFVLLCFIWYFYPLSCYIFNSVIFAVITIFILTGTLIFRILYLNNIYKYKIPIVVKINMKNHLLRIDLI